MAEGEKKFSQIGQLKEGNYVLIDGVPCKIVEVENISFASPAKGESAFSFNVSVKFYSY